MWPWGLSTAKVTASLTLTIHMHGSLPGTPLRTGTPTLALGSACFYCVQGGGGLRSGTVQSNGAKLRKNLRCCNQTKLNLPKPQEATILHRSLRMFKQMEWPTGIGITTTSGPQYHLQIEA